MTESTHEKTQQIDGAAFIDKVIPKLCTTINIAVLNNKNIVMTLLYAEPNSVALIDRVVIDRNHASSLKDTLVAILNDMEEENDTNSE